MVQIRLDPTSPKVRVRKRGILGAASRVFRKKGFHEAGMRDIAAACGMTVGNLYYYFKNKQELLAFCQEDAASRLLEREVTIVGDEKSNTVLVSASPRYMDRVRQMILELDVDPPQVLIQVLLAEISLTGGAVARRKVAPSSEVKTDLVPS